jgi:hypothetical protein
LAADGLLTDPRLTGTWRSDAARTVAEWRERRPISDEQAARLSQVFGYLRVTYAGQHVTYDFSLSPFPGVERASTCGRYAVVARDDSSVVIFAPGSRSAVPELVHLRFCGPDVYWVHTEESPLREYFVREPNQG